MRAAHAGRRAVDGAPGGWHPSGWSDSGATSSGWTDDLLGPRRHPGERPGPVPARTEEPTIGALVHDLTQQLPELIRSELRLAQAEVAEKGKRAGLGIGMFSVAGLLAFFGVAVLITTAILALDLVLPAWLAALIVAVVLLAAGGVVALVGKKKVAAGVTAQARAGDRGRQGRHRDRQGSPAMTPAHPRAARGRDRGPAGPARRHRRPARPEAGREGTGQGPASAGSRR